MTESPSYHEQLHAKTIQAMRFADWIYHDCRLDCDGESTMRTRQRVDALHAEHGEDAWFGVASAWATRAYWRLEKAYRRAGATHKPVVTPVLKPAEDDTESPEEIKRAYVSAQQFFSAVSNDDPELAFDIFKAAYDSSQEEAHNLLHGVLAISIIVSNQAERMGR